MTSLPLDPNPGKHLLITVDGYEYARFPIKTNLITDRDDIAEIVTSFVPPLMAKGDLLFISERAVATSQGRAFPIKDIIPSQLARFLVRFVYRSPYGIGIGSPWTMELAIREAGLLRILLASVASALTKPLGIRRVFYRVAGHNINAIDGPAPYVLPPYNEYAKLGPAQPTKEAQTICDLVGIETVVIDANDLGVAVLGKSDGAPSDEFCQRVFADNPLGQSNEQTPLCLIRRWL